MNVSPLNIVLHELATALRSKQSLRALLGQIADVWGEQASPDVMSAIRINDPTSAPGDGIAITILPDTAPDPIAINVLADVSDAEPETLDIRIGEPEAESVATVEPAAPAESDTATAAVATAEPPAPAADAPAASPPAAASDSEAEFVLSGDEFPEDVLTITLEDTAAPGGSAFLRAQAGTQYLTLEQRIRQRAQQVRDLLQFQTQASANYQSNRDALLQQRQQALAALDQQIAAAQQQASSSITTLQSSARLWAAVSGLAVFIGLLFFLAVVASQASSQYAIISLLMVGAGSAGLLLTYFWYQQRQRQLGGPSVYALRQQRQGQDGQFSNRLAQLDADYADEQRRLRAQRSAMQRTLYEQLIPDASSLLDHWIGAIATELRQDHPNWDDPSWQNLSPASAAPALQPSKLGVRIGTLNCPDVQATVPAVIDPIGDQRHVFIQDGDPDRRADLLKDIVLRLLTRFPAGLARLVLVDANELGHTLRLFATQLPEDLRRDKAYDTVQEIAGQVHRLRDRISEIHHHVLVEHDSIDSYNLANPEMPAPYHFIVINNFPGGFNSQALTELRDVLHNGPRTGIYAIVAVSDTMPTSQDFSLAAYMQGAYILKTHQTAIQWNSPALSDYTVSYESPPSDDMIKRLLNAISQQHEAQQLSLSYDRIASRLPARWTMPSTPGLQAPVGLTFGGVPHHVIFNDEFVHGLVGGRTGMGKTVLLHDLICGLTQTYTPEELELYLLDFKGTEFNTYAKNALPHARVVAVSCDPEVGKSVLQGLLEELDRRRALFDQADVDHIRNYRQRGQRLPRILLIIDEVQELTAISNTRLGKQIESDLTRLLKLGRAAGIHVLIGTQSPSGVLTPAMLQQIAIRVCLRADQQVSRLVLSDNNEAAALLERQGEAVYNAYNGVAEKNVLIRAALLTRSGITGIVKSLSEQAVAAGYETNMIYFDGATRGRLADNPRIKAALARADAPPRAPQIVLPLGNSILLKEDTAALLSQQRYANLLIIGGETVQRHAMLGNTLAALVAQLPAQTMFYLVDLTHAGEPFAPLLRAFNRMPHEFQFAHNATLGLDLLADAHQLVKERQAQATETQQFPNQVFFVVFGIEHFVHLKAADRFDKPEARRQFDELLKEGPALSIHTLAVSQTLAKGEFLDHAEFGQRICFHIAEDDSRKLLDTDDGTKLTHDGTRAIFRRYDAAYGDFEKFKPYLPLQETDITDLAQRLRQRASQTPRSDSGEQD